MRTVDSERLIFEIVNKFREHRRMAEQIARERETNVFRLIQGSGNYGPKWLEDLVLLMLYHGTELSPEEIAQLKYEDLSKVGPEAWQIKSPLKKQEITVTVEDELFYVLEFLTKNTSIPVARKSEDLEESLALLTKKKVAPAHPLLDVTQEHVVATVERFSGEPGKRTIAPYFALSADDFAVIPTPLRLNANPRYTGKGVTIAMIDSGFFPHPDLVKPENRILAYTDITNPAAGWSDLETQDIDSWHGMQTSVSACGNGFLSQGLYRGVASDARLVLVKVSGKPGNFASNLVRAIEWVMEKREQFGIRIVNISLGCTDSGLPGEHPVNKAVEEAVAAGLIVVAAAGNDPYQPVQPPASALSAIAVGGLDDDNVLFQEHMRMYHSSFGSPVEGYVKPEVIAPAIWVAATLLPGSPLYYESLAMQRISAAADEDVPRIFAEERSRLKLPSGATFTTAPQIRKWIEGRIQAEKIIATHYQHVDGTSFASPITASVIAQMLEVNPKLTPKRVKKILIGTAKRLPGVPAFMQGFGVISPYDAVEAAIADKDPVDEIRSPAPKIFKNRVTFEYFNPAARSVYLVGDFNQWDEGATPMQRDDNGNWTAGREFFFPGRYRYKFLVDGRWLQDPLNSRQEEDGYSSKNSLFTIHTPGNAEEVFERFCKAVRMLKHSDREARRSAFAELDEVLQSPMSNRSYRVREFYVRCLRHALSEMEGPRPQSKWKIWQLYNQGYVVSDGQFNLGFDIVTGRHVAEVYWDLEPTVVSRLAEILDILVVTHRHADHLDLELVNMMVNLGKKVVMPREICGIIHRGSIGLGAGESREFTFPTHGGARVEVRAHQGTHVYLKGRDIPLRYYEVTTSKGLRLAHLGDHDYTKALAGMDQVDIAMVKCGGVTPELSDELAFRTLEDFPARMFVAGHVSELGHPVKGGRISYETAFKCAESIAVPCAVLAWGEALEAEDR